MKADEAIGAERNRRLKENGQRSKEKVECN
jgi:hypothetical protein